jgi:CspA family cold shock protein
VGFISYARGKGVDYFYQEVKCLEGIVKRWLDGRGYGFLSVEGNDKDIFVHHSGLVNVYELSVGQNVDFDMEDSPRGPQAVNVKIVE